MICHARQYEPADHPGTNSDGEDIENELWTCCGCGVVFASPDRWTGENPAHWLDVTTVEMRSHGENQYLCDRCARTITLPSNRTGPLPVCNCGITDNLEKKI